MKKLDNKNAKLAAEYIRMSTDDQSNSPERQKMELKRLRDRDGYTVVATYMDEGQSGTKSKNRMDFQQCLADAKAGKFEYLLLVEQSRLSREDMFRVFEHWKQFREAGVKLVTAQRGLIDFEDMGSMLTAIIDQFGAREEVKKLASRVASGLRLKVERRERIGIAPFGYDREYSNPAGDQKVVVSFRDKFRKPKEWKMKLVPSAEAGAVDAVKMAFKMAAGGESVQSIAAALNKAGVRNRAISFNTIGVRQMLANHSYCGDTMYGKYNDYNRNPFAKVVDEPTLVRDTHEPLVSRKTFATVQAILARVKKWPRRRTAQPGILTGILFCSACGCRMHGTSDDRSSEYCGNFQLGYRCASFRRFGLSPNADCKRRFRRKLLDKAVLETLRAMISERDGAFSRAALARSGEAGIGSEDSETATKLAAVREKIARGEDNILLADKDSIPALNRKLAEWRVEERSLADKAAAEGHSAKLLPQVEQAMRQLSRCLDNLDLMPPERLNTALRVIVKAVRARIATSDEGFKMMQGEIEVHPGFGINEPIPFSVVELPDQDWRDIRDFLASIHPRSATAAEIYRALGWEFKGSEKTIIARMYRNIQRLAERGFCEKASTTHGFRASLKALQTANTGKQYRPGWEGSANSDSGDHRRLQQTPFFNRHKRSWFVKLRGKNHDLGADKSAAYAAFEKLTKATVRSEKKQAQKLAERRGQKVVVNPAVA